MNSNSILNHRTLHLLALDISLFPKLSVLSLQLCLALDEWDEDEDNFGQYEAYESDALLILQRRSLKRLNLSMNLEWIEKSALVDLLPGASRDERERQSRRTGLNQYLDAGILNVCHWITIKCHLDINIENLNQVYEDYQDDVFPDSARWDLSAT